MKHIAFVLLGLGSGGIENYLLRFLTYSKEQIIPTVICTKKAEGALEKEFRALGIKIITQKVSYFNLIHFLRIYKTLKKNNYDAICDFSGDFSAFVLLISKIAGIKNRIVFYRNSKYQFKMTLPKLLYVKILKSLLKLSNPKFFSNSKYALDVFHPGWRKNTKIIYKVIPNGVNFKALPKNNDNQILKSSLNIPKNCLIIGHVGNFRSAKNHATIIKTAKDITLVNKNVRFLLIGRDVQAGINEELEKNNLNQYFIMPGIRKDIPELLNLMDIFFFPSTNEGQPNALIEAMLYQVPVFASNILTIRECTPKEVGENLYPPHDDKAFSNAIKTYLKTGKTYDVKKVSDWAKREFDPEVRFNEFLIELNK